MPSAKLGMLSMSEWNFSLWEEGESGYPEKNLSEHKKKYHNNLNPLKASALGLDPELHWREATALTLVPSLLPASQ